MERHCESSRSGLFSNGRELRIHPLTLLRLRVFCRFSIPQSSGRHFTSFSNFCRLRPEPRASIAFPSFIRHPRRYRQGDAFFHLRIPTAMSRLKRERAAIERVIERLERKAEGCEGEMKGLKVEL